MALYYRSMRLTTARRLPSEESFRPRQRAEDVLHRTCTCKVSIGNPLVHAGCGTIEPGVYPYHTYLSSISWGRFLIGARGSLGRGNRTERARSASSFSLSWGNIWNLHFDRRSSTEFFWNQPGQRRAVGRSRWKHWVRTHIQ